MPQSLSLTQCLDESNYAPDAHLIQGGRSYGHSNRVDPSHASAGTLVDNARGIGRGITRTPSPTPSEARVLKGESAIDWKAMRTKEYWKNSKNISKAE